MKLYHFIHNKFVSDEDLKTKFSLEQLLNLSAATTRDIKPVPYKPIGMGKPLLVEWLTIYLGDTPEKLFGGKKDILGVSGVKGYADSGSAPKALNVLQKKTDDYDFIYPEAFQNGSRIVFYSPALDKSTLTFSFELIADTFNEQQLETLSALLNTAAGIPVFAEAAIILSISAKVAKISSVLGKRIFEKGPFLNSSFELRFDTAGIAKSLTGYKLLFNKNETLPDDLTIEEKDGKMMLIDRLTGQPFRGENAYVILNIDGSKKDELSSFSTYYASAQLLSKFYQPDESGVSTVESLTEAMQLYNDAQFHNKAKATLEKLKKQTDTTSEEYKQLLLDLKTFQSNIKEDVFKLNIPAKYKSTTEESA
ncbi:MAG: hypothetical protein SF053_01005 [Bacteroidia bacterium]|nr:hypothetical protein [Bacteroidia bacterium]